MYQNSQPVALKWNIALPEKSLARLEIL